MRRAKDGGTVVEGPDGCVAGGRHQLPLLLPSLPSEVPFGLIGTLLPSSLPVGARLTLRRLERDRSLDLLEAAAAVAESELARSRTSSASAERTERERAVESARALAQKVGRREQELWRVGLVLFATHRSLRRAQELRAEIGRRAKGLGFVDRVPVHESRLALAPARRDGAEERPSGYWHTLPTDGAAAFFPFLEESVVEPAGVLVGLLLEDASPVVLDRWVHPSHSWGIFGTTGAGKSFAAALYASRSRWRDPALEVIVLDPLGEFVPWARALGGTVLDLGPGAGPHLNPLDPVTTGGDRTEKAGRVGTMLRALFPTLRDEEGALLDRCLHGLYEAGPAVPTFSELSQAVARAGPDAGRLPGFLEVLTRGSLAYLDGPTAAGPGGPVHVLTLRRVPEEYRAFHLCYLLDWMLGRVRLADRPRLLLIDEAHGLVRRPATAEFLDTVARQLRHYRAGLLLLSQHPEDFLATEPGRSVLRNLRATLLLRLTSVSEAARTFFRLTEAEAQWLPRARMPREAGYSEGLLRVGEAHHPIAVVASTPEYEWLRERLSLAAAEAAAAPPRAPL